MKRKASAVWSGDLKTGKGSISTESGTLKANAILVQHALRERRRHEPRGTHRGGARGLFLDGVLVGTRQGRFQAGIHRDDRDRHAWKCFRPAPTVTESHLDMTAKIPGIDQAKFTEIANGAKAGCPISRLLNAKVSLDAKLEA